MQTPGIPADEQERVAALRALRILDTPAEERFDRITRLAATIMDVPTALVTFVDADRQWFKSRYGLDVSETPRDIAFCGHAILGAEALCIPDTALDQRFADNPLVLGSPNVRFYVGMPLQLPDGLRVGTLCAIDSRPRWPTDVQLAALRDLADSVLEQLAIQQAMVANRLLLDRDARMQKLLATVVDGIITIDDQGTIESVNPATESIFGHSRVDLVGKNVSMLMPEPFHSEHDGYLKNYRSSGVARMIGSGREVLGLRSNGETFPLELAVGEMTLSDRTMFVGIVRDIGERKRAEALLVKRNEELRVAMQRVESVDQIKTAFLANMSHELRTPLNSILGFTGILLQQMAGPITAEQSKQLGMVRNSARHLLRLLNEVLDFSRSEAGQLQVGHEPFDLRESIEKVLGVVAPLAEKKGLTMRLSVGADISIMLGDCQRVEQILSSLLGNAIKFCQSGEVGLTAETIIKDGPWVRIVVHDSGAGIRPDHLKMLFKPFQQIEAGLSRPHEGTGLALAICQRLVTLMGGTIGVESRWGEGTIFTVTLPLQAEESPA